jgi:hypothetical protein
MHELDAKDTEASHSMPANVSGGKEISSETQRALLRKEAPHKAAIPAPAARANIDVKVTQISLDEAAAVIVLEPPQKLLLSRQLLQEYGLEDEADVLANNGIRREGDLRFVTDQVIKELPLSTLSKAKLKELAKAFRKEHETLIQRVQILEAAIPAVPLSLNPISDFTPAQRESIQVQIPGTLSCTAPPVLGKQNDREIETFLPSEPPLLSDVYRLRLAASRRADQGCMPAHEAQAHVGGKFSQVCKIAQFSPVSL